MRSSALASCALRDNGTAWCWGEMYVGDGTQDSVTSPEPAPVRTDSTEPWTAVAAGDSHTCAVRAGGGAVVLGQNAYGQLGRPGPGRDPAPVAGGGSWSAVTAGFLHSCGVRSDASLWCWGDDGTARSATARPAGRPS